MNQMNKNAVGLVVGSFMGLAHLVWALLVALAWAKPLMDWVLGLHMMTLSYTITGFSFVTALGLIILTFVVGYVGGWVFAGLWNFFKK